MKIVSLITKNKTRSMMSTLFLFLLCFVLFACSQVTYENQDSDNKGDVKLPGSSKSISFTSDGYANPFEDIRKSEADINSKWSQIWSTYYSLSNSNRLYFEEGSVLNGKTVPENCAVIWDPAPENDFGSRVKSEGMSYGMMVMVQTDHQAEFDKLWNFARTYMRTNDPAHPDYRYYAWDVDADGVHNDDNPAPDGEEWIAAALYFAAGRWGNGTGIYDYKAEADEILDAMKNRPDITGQVTTRSGTKTTTITSLMNVTEKMIRFTPDSDYFSSNIDHTDPSYHLPHFYELFSLWGPEADSQFWKDAAEVSRYYLAKNTHNTTGLPSTYAKFDGTPYNRPESDFNEDEYNWDAWRTAMNYALDLHWFNNTNIGNVEEELEKLVNFFDSKGAASYVQCYTLDGTPTDSYRNSGQQGTNACAAIALESEAVTNIVTDFWNAGINTGQYRYYGGLLHSMSFLICSGRFKMYTPPGYPTVYPAGKIIAPAKPVAAIVSPQSGLSIKENENLTIEVNAADPDGTVSEVRIYDIFAGSSDLLATLTSSSGNVYTYNWAAANPGQHRIEAIAVDNEGNESQADGINVIVTKTGGEEPELEVDYRMSSWNSGFSINISVTNNSDQDITDWVITFDLADGQKITNMWNADYTQTGNSVEVSTVHNWNKTIGKNAARNIFGFNGTHTGQTAKPAAIYLNGVLMKIVE